MVAAGGVARLEVLPQERQVALAVGRVVAAGNFGAHAALRALRAGAARAPVHKYVELNRIKIGLKSD